MSAAARLVIREFDRVRSWLDFIVRQRIDVIRYLLRCSSNVLLFAFVVVVSDLAHPIHAANREAHGSKIRLPNKSRQINRRRLCLRYCVRPIIPYFLSPSSQETIFAIIAAQ